MKEKKLICALFDALRPIIIEKLLNPEVPVSSRGQTFFYDGIDSTEGSWTVDVTQLIVPLNDEMAEVLSPDEYFTAHPSEYHNVWYVYPDKDITLLCMAGSNILFSPSKQTTDKTICFALASCAMEITM